MDTTNAIIRYEQGDLVLPEVLSLFSSLIRTGDAWSIQGSYGRTARNLIEAGLITHDGEITDAADDLLLDLLDAEIMTPYGEITDAADDLLLDLED